MKISVIISTYNSPAWLEKVLAGYLCQIDSDFEIMIADDGSREETRELVERLAASFTVPVRHIWQPDDGFRKCTILNKAIRECRGEYLIFTDGDCIPRSDLISVHRALAQRGHFLSGGYCKLPMPTSEAISPSDIRSGDAFQVRWLMRHGYRPTLKWLKILARPWGLDGLLNRLPFAKPTFNGNNSSCYRKDALAIGGFDERMGYGGEDREFGYRLQNSGISPKVIRYSALALHLDHKRGYV
ncbi:MAG: glycosyltransferase family 2 protein, partial [Nitratireductor sp.]|nr:glycosyltransferase family 2 protein [Nitratireductor sp.]